MPKTAKKKDIFKIHFYVTPPCFLESVFCQELEKTGFKFVGDRESDEIHLFLYRTHLIYNTLLYKVTVFRKEGYQLSYVLNKQSVVNQVSSI